MEKLGKRDFRDCVKIARLAKTKEQVELAVDIIKEHSDRDKES
jgi:hypothetical protein